MCDELTNKDAEEYLRRNALTRREFSKRGVAATIAMMLPPVANAVDVVEQDVMVETPDGMADCYFVHPASGKHAAVIVWPDIVGTRPAFRAMGKRLAESGYSVIVVNPYYRTAKGQVVPDGKGFRDPGNTRAADAARPIAVTGHLRYRWPCPGWLAGQAAVSRYGPKNWHNRLLHDGFLHDATGSGDSRTGSAPADRSTVADWRRMPRTAHTC